MHTHTHTHTLNLTPYTSHLARSPRSTESFAGRDPAMPKRYTIHTHTHTHTHTRHTTYTGGQEVGPDAEHGAAPTPLPAPAPQSASGSTYVRISRIFGPSFHVSGACLVFFCFDLHSQALFISLVHDDSIVLVLCSRRYT